MIAATSFALGMATAGLRSMLGYTIASFFILVSFGVSALLSGAHAPFLDLGIAILGFNFGIAAEIALVAAGMYLSRPKSV